VRDKSFVWGQLEFDLTKEQVAAKVGEGNQGQKAVRLGAQGKDTASA
jgi:hypothetical protein